MSKRKLESKPEDKEQATKRQRTAFELKRSEIKQDKLEKEKAQLQEELKAMKQAADLKEQSWKEQRDAAIKELTTLRAAVAQMDSVKAEFQQFRQELVSRVDEIKAATRQDQHLLMADVRMALPMPSSSSSSSSSSMALPRVLDDQDESPPAAADDSSDDAHDYDTKETKDSEDKETSSSAETSSTSLAENKRKTTESMSRLDEIEYKVKRGGYEYRNKHLTEEQKAAECSVQIRLFGKPGDVWILASDVYAACQLPRGNSADEVKRWFKSSDNLKRARVPGVKTGNAVLVNMPGLAQLAQHLLGTKCKRDQTKRQQMEAGIEFLRSRVIEAF